MSKQTFSRRNLLARLVTTAAAGLGLSTPPGGQPKPAVGNCGSGWEPPPKQQGNNLNLILLVSDTFRADNLESYGSDWIECPNLNRFATDSVVFEDFYPEGMPTIPIRRQLMTGRRILPFYYYPQHEPVQLPGWHCLYNEDVTLSETLREAGYISALVADVPHMQRPDRNFQRGYQSFEWIRGQEFDYYGTVPHTLLDVRDIVPDDYLAKIPGLHYELSQYKVNRQRWGNEAESLVELVARAAIRWLKMNHSQRPFFLHLEAFDPHEPWDPPSSFLRQYLPNPEGYSWLEPPYENIKLSEDATRRMRVNYAGEASCVDYWLGKVLETIGEQGLFDNSIVVFLSDHGALLGEQGQFLKGPERLRTQVTHIPLLIRLPGKQHAGKKVAGFIQIPDLMPTLLALLGLKPPSRVTGKNFWPLVSGETKSLRDHVVSAYAYIAAVRTREWNYSEVWKPAGYKGEYPPQLYNVEKDPKELISVADKYPGVAQQLSLLMREYMASGEKITRGSFHERERVGGAWTYYAGTG